MRAGAKQFAQACDLHGQVAFLDRQTGPARLHQIGLGHRFALRCDQSQQQGHAALTHHDGLAIAQQHPAFAVELKRPYRG